MKWLELSANLGRDIEKLYEASTKQLRVNTWNRAERAKSQKLKIKYMGVNKKGVIWFKVTSGTIPGKWYDITIELKDFKEAKEMILDDKPLTNRQILQLSMSGDIAVHCTCPDFKYRFSYLAWAKGYGIMRETRFPKVRNRRLQGTTCKHLQATFNGFNFYFSSILSDFIKQGLLESKAKKKLSNSKTQLDKNKDNKKVKEVKPKKSRATKKANKKKNNEKIKK